MSTEQQSRPLQSPKVKDFAIGQQPLLPEAELIPAEEVTPTMEEELPVVPIPIPIPVPKKQRKQLRLDLGGPATRLKQRIGTIRDFFKRRDQQLELMPYWKDFTPALAIVSTLFLSVGAGLAGISLFSQIQPRIPFYYNAFTGYWEQVDKSILLVLPFVIFVVNIIVIRFSFDIHKHDPRLSRTLNLMVSTVNLLFVVGLAQIYTLVVNF